jgi:hypothetical protein
MLGPGLPLLFRATVVDMKPFRLCAGTEELMSQSEARSVSSLLYDHFFYNPYRSKSCSVGITEVGAYAKKMRCV